MRNLSGIHSRSVSAWAHGIELESSRLISWLDYRQGEADSAINLVSNPDERWSFPDDQIVSENQMCLHSFDNNKLWLSKMSIIFRLNRIHQIELSRPPKLACQLTITHINIHAKALKGQTPSDALNSNGTTTSTEPHISINEPAAMFGGQTHSREQTTSTLKSTVTLFDNESLVLWG